MDKKIEFAKILSSNIDDEDDNVKESELDIIDSLIKDIDLKKNYNSRYNFYINFIKMYNQNPKIIKYIYTKLNAIKNLNENEKGLLGKLNFASKGGYAKDVSDSNNILNKKIILLINKIKLGKQKNIDIKNSLHKKLKDLIINAYGKNIKEEYVNKVVKSIIKKGGGIVDSGDKKDILQKITSTMNELNSSRDKETKITENISKNKFISLIKDITSNLEEKYKDINDINDEIDRSIYPIIEDINKIAGTTAVPTNIATNPVIQNTQTIPPKSSIPALTPQTNRVPNQGANQGVNQGADQGANQGVNQGVNQGANQGVNQGANQGVNQGANQGANQVSQGVIARPIPSYQGYSSPLPTNTSSQSIEELKKVVKQEDIDNNNFRKVVKVLQKHYELKNLINFNNKNYMDDDDKDNEYNNPILQLNYDIDKFNDNDNTSQEDLKKIKKKLNSFENNPTNPYLHIPISFEDRLVFIFTTFLIRYVSLILIQWSIDINIIKSFEEGFIYYAVIYIAIFWFFTLFINIDNTFKVDYMNISNALNSIRSLFYYFYMGTNGITRLLVHSCIICVLIIVPVILNIKKYNNYTDEDEGKKEKLISYEERIKLNKSLSLFTIYLWILTSIIATKF
jgi:hypothetical protein